MLSYEEQSGLTHEALLSRALEEVSTVVTLNQQQIDVEETFTNTLDVLLGSENYYFEVTPLLRGVSISYVLDGSSTMASARSQVNTALPNLISDLEDLFGSESAIFTHLYILDTKDEEPHCPGFSLQEGVTCEDLTADIFYTTLMNKGFEPPIPSPFRSYNEWVFATHAAEPGEFSESDWAAGAAYASYNYQANTAERALTNKHIIVTVADELTTSSKADSCFGLERSDDLLFCQLCDSACPVNRAERIVNQTTEILAEHGDFFLGFTRFERDYVYDTFLDGFSKTEYNCEFIDDINACTGVCDRDADPSCIDPPANVHWCNQDACGACTPNPPPSEQFGFHRNCDTAIHAHLEQLAATTGGAVHPLTDLELLTDAVFQFFDAQVSNFNFSIGTKNLSRERYVVEQPITLANGERITLTFWIYE